MVAFQDEWGPNIPPPGESIPWTRCLSFTEARVEGPTGFRFLTAIDGWGIGTKRYSVRGERSVRQSSHPDTNYGIPESLRGRWK